MLDFINKLFGKKDKKQTKPTPSQKYNMISFYVDEWNRYNMFVAIEIPNESATQEFGKLLYLLNSGKYEQNILDYLVSVSKEKPFLTPHIQESLISWATCVQNNLEHKNESPYVRPTEVFR